MLQGLLDRLLKSGVKTSEFWVAILALVLPYVIDLPSDRVSTWTAAHGWVGGLVAAVYIAARAYIKGHQLQAIGEPALADAQTQAALQLQPGAGVVGAPLELRNNLAIARAAVAQNIDDPAVLKKIVADIAAASQPGTGI